MSKNQKTEFSIVGLDDGHDGIKVFLGRDSSTGEHKQFRMLSRAAVGIVNMGEDDTLNRELIVVDGQTFTVSESLSKFEDTKNEDYPISKLNKALVYQGLRLANPEHKVVKIATGLPVNRFYSGSTMNKQLINQKKHNLLNMQNVYNKYDESKGIPPIKIADHIVLCEANAAYYDVLLSDEDQGQLSQIAKDYEIFEYGAAVIDIGGRTTDCVVVNPGGGTLNASRSGTLDIGMLNFQENLRQDLKQTYKWNFISEAQLTNALKTGFYGVGGNRTDISNLIEKHKKEMLNSIENFLMSTIGDGSDVPAIILVGGGAYNLGTQIKERYSNLIIPNDVEFSNARGFYKLFKYKFQD